MIKLPEPMHINDQYSIEMDMVLGWQPKYPLKGLVPFTFNGAHDSIYESTVLYKGFRPLNNLVLHDQFANTSSYPYKHQPHSFPKKQFGMNPTIQSDFSFDSSFESGNLDAVIQIGPREYDLYMRVDSNTRGHTSWYYFSVSGTGRIRLNIKNFKKSKSLYERNMKPYIKDPEWHQGGEDVHYRKQEKYTLSFTVEINNYMEIAYCVPYTYSQMLREIQVFQKSILCESLCGVNVPLITIPGDDEMVIVIQARVHPGEANSSWVMHGLLQWLQSNKLTCTTKIIPMLNPDGVILGNYRTGPSGRDLNRRFRNTDPLLFPEVAAVKNLLKQLSTVYNERVIFIDLHGHSVRKNIFIYGPEYPIWHVNYYRSRLLARLLSSSPMFRYYSCMFRISEEKKGTARGVFSDLYDIPNCFTIETSNGSYYDGKETKDFGISDWINFGKLLGSSLNNLIDQIREIAILFPKRQQKNNIIKKKRSQTYHEDRLKQIKQTTFGTKLQDLFISIQESSAQHDQSVSEGRSDSESESEDLSDEDLDNFRTEILKYRQVKNYSIERTPTIKTSKREGPSNIQTTYVPQSEKKITQKLSPKKLQITEVLRRSAKIQVPMTKPEYALKSFRDSGEVEITAVPLSESFTRPSTQQFLPMPDIVPPTTSNHFKGHQKLKSQQVIKADARKPKSQIKNPLLQQLSLTTKCNTGQRNLEALGVTIKQKLFIHRRFDEPPPPVEQYHMETCRPIKKGLVPASFYSTYEYILMNIVKRHPKKSIAVLITLLSYLGYKYRAALFEWTFNRVLQKMNEKIVSQMSEKVKRVEHTNKFLAQIQVIHNEYYSQQIFKTFSKQCFMYERITDLRTAIKQLSKSNPDYADVRNRLLSELNTEFYIFNIATILLLKQNEFGLLVTRMVHLKHIEQLDILLKDDHIVILGILDDTYKLFVTQTYDFIRQQVINSLKDDHKYDQKSAILDLIKQLVIKVPDQIQKQIFDTVKNQAELLNRQRFQFLESEKGMKLSSKMIQELLILITSPQFKAFVEYSIAFTFRKISNRFSILMSKEEQKMNFIMLTKIDKILEEEFYAEHAEEQNKQFYQRTLKQAYNKDPDPQLPKVLEELRLDLFLSQTIIQFERFLVIEQ